MQWSCPQLNSWRISAWPQVVMWPSWIRYLCQPVWRWHVVKSRRTQRLIMCLESKVWRRSNQVHLSESESVFHGRSRSELVVLFISAVPLVMQVIIHPSISVIVWLFGKASFVLHWITAGVVKCRSKALLEWLRWVCLTAGVLHLEKWLL